MPSTPSSSPSFPPLSLIDQINSQQGFLELTDRDLCTAVGFEQENVLTMIKAGTMRLPLSKVPGFATALELDPAELFKLALRESDPELLAVVEEVSNPMHLNATEVNLIRYVRELSGDTPSAPIVFGGKGVIALVAV
jgi:hypothetical protein